MLASQVVPQMVRRTLGMLVAAGFCVAVGMLAHSASQSQTGSIWQLPAGKDFPTVNGDLANRRYSTLDKMNTSNIQKLGGAWLTHVEDGRPSSSGGMEAAPVVVDGVMYITTGAQNVVALNAKTGEIKWKYTYTKVGFPNRGVAVAEGKVFFGRRDNTLVALDQHTGQVVWSTKLTDQRVASTTAPPLYYDGLVYIGIAGGDAGARGHVGAYDAKTGKEVWKFYTIPGPGERGGNTWEGDSYKHGGGGVWTNPAVDPDLGMIYFAVGNPSPDNDGTTRGGDNLFTDSILALDVKTGAYKWHFQEVHHDLWDYDAGSSPVIADITYRGQRRQILMHAGKTGFFYILDRANGKPLIGIEERPVPQEPRMKTARTQPYPVGDAFVSLCAEPELPGYLAGCLFTPYFEKPVLLRPGQSGGNAYAPPTFSPETNLVYVPGSDISTVYEFRRQVWNEERQRWDTLNGEGSGRSRPAGIRRSGTLTAMDPTTNKIVWQKKTYPMGGGNGLLSTAGGLLFHGEFDGNIVARDIKNGDVLWKFQTGAGANAPPVMYEVDGEPYVAILAGGNSRVGAGFGEFGDSLWAFKLGGTLPPAPAPPSPPEEYGSRSGIEP